MRVDVWRPVLAVILCCSAMELGTAMTRDEALENARRHLGLPESAAQLLAANEIVLDAETVPFLAGELNGQKAWCFTFQQGFGEVAHLGSLSVVMDPTGKRILKALATSPNHEPSDSLPSMDSLERQLRNGDDRYARPTTLGALPVTSLAKALEVAERSGHAGVRRATQVVAYFVLHDTVRYRNRPVWIVHARGLPVDEARQRRGPHPGAWVPRAALNHRRHVVDAETGKWLTSDTIGQPE
jgi:hypothetical protein